jgi:hypothetical protein
MFLVKKVEFYLSSKKNSKENLNTCSVCGKIVNQIRIRKVILNNFSFYFMTIILRVCVCVRVCDPLLYLLSFDIWDYYS